MPLPGFVDFPQQPDYNAARNELMSFDIKKAIHHAGARQQQSLTGFFTSPLGRFLFLLFVFTAAFIIRRIGLKFGSPFLTHTDEWAIIEPAYTMTRDHTLDPGNYQRPNQITQMLNLVILNIVSLLKTGQDISISLPLDRFGFYVTARFLTAILGALIPLVAYKIGKESSLDYAIPAALLFAFFPSYVVHSHFVTPDIPITLFTLLVILFALRYVRTLNAKYLYLAVFMAAVNTAEKYPGLISFGIVVFAIIWVQKSRYRHQPVMVLKHSLVESLKFFGFYVLFLYLVAPNLFLHFGVVIEQIRNEARPLHPGADGLGWAGNLLYYATSFASSANFIVILLVAVGIAGMFIARNYLLLFGFYGLVYWVVLSKLALHWERWALPMYTFPLLLASFGAAFLWQVIKEKKVLRATIRVVLGLSLAALIMNSLSSSIRMTYPHTTVAAYQFCRDMGIREDNTLYEGYSPFMPDGVKYLDLSQINAETEYIIISSGMYNRFYAEPERYAAKIELYDRVRSENTLLITFSKTPPASTSSLLAWADDIRYYISVHLGIKPAPRFSGPTIEIYQVSP